MGRKKTTTLYIDGALIQRCKELGINISNTCETILRTVITTPTTTEEEIRLAILTGERKTQQKYLAELTSEVTRVTERVAYFTRRIENQQTLVDEVTRSNEIALQMRTLNQEIKDAEYDIDKVKVSAENTLTRLVNLGIDAHNDAWLAKHIERIQRLHI